MSAGSSQLRGAGTPYSGIEILFDTNRDGNYEIYVMNAGALVFQVTAYAPVSGNQDGDSIEVNVLLRSRRL